jgi:hypothetical protein
MWDEFEAYLVDKHGSNWPEPLASHKERLQKKGRFPKTGKRLMGDSEEELEIQSCKSGTGKGCSCQTGCANTA